MRKQLLLLLFFFSVIAIPAQDLNKLDEKGKNTAGYHDMAARFAVLTGKTSEVYEHVAAAAQLVKGRG